MLCIASITVNGLLTSTFVWSIGNKLEALTQLPGTSFRQWFPQSYNLSTCKILRAFLYHTYTQNTSLTRLASRNYVSDQMEVKVESSLTVQHKQSERTWFNHVQSKSTAQCRISVALLGFEFFTDCITHGSISGYVQANSLCASW